MLDRKSTKKPIGHVKKHLKLTMYAGTDVKDEAYCQVLKQINGHPDKEKTKRGWNFLAIMACTYAPSNVLYYSLLNYLFFQIKNSKDADIVLRSNYIFIRLVKSFEKQRKYMPSEEEIIHIEVYRLYLFREYEINASSHIFLQWKPLRSEVGKLYIGWRVKTIYNEENAVS